MKKALLILLVAPFMLMSCGGGLSALYNQNWFVDSITTSEGTIEYPMSITMELLGQSISMQSTFSLWITDAGSGYLKSATKTGDDIKTEKSNFSYEGDNKTIKLVFSDGEYLGEVWGPFEFTVKGDTLTLEDSEGSMVFTARNMPNFE